MKLFPLMLAAALLTSWFSNASAQELKIAVVDFKKVLLAHPDAKRTNEDLKQRMANTEKVIETKKQEMEDIRSSMEQVVKDHQGPDKTLTTEGTKMFRELQAKAASVQKLIFDIQGRNEAEWNKQRNDALNSLSVTIRELVTKANDGRFAIVLDTSALTLDRSPIVVDASGATDITAQVIELLPKENE